MVDEANEIVVDVRDANLTGPVVRAAVPPKIRGDEPMAVAQRIGEGGPFVGAGAGGPMHTQHRWSTSEDIVVETQTVALVD